MQIYLLFSPIFFIHNFPNPPFQPLHNNVCVYVYVRKIGEKSIVCENLCDLYKYIKHKENWSDPKEACENFSIEQKKTKLNKEWKKLAWHFLFWWISLYIIPSSKSNILDIGCEKAYIYATFAEHSWICPASYVHWDTCWWATNGWMG